MPWSAARSLASAKGTKSPRIIRSWIEDWSVTQVTRTHKDLAREQLGSSGSGNHFAEFGVLLLEQDDAQLGLKAGQYVALLTHSGSRGTGRGGLPGLQRHRPIAAAREVQGPRASGLAGHGQRGGAGVLGGDEPDGRVCGGQPRSHPSERLQAGGRAAGRRLWRITTTSPGRKPTKAGR